MKLSESQKIGSKSLVKSQNQIEVGTPCQIRIAVDEVERYPVHWVPLVKEANNTPIPCASVDCDKIVLPGGEVLHSYPSRLRARFIAWDVTEQRAIIFECSPSIHDDIIYLHSENPDWGDVTKYDVRISAVPIPGPFKRQYKVEPVRSTFGQPLPPNAVAALREAYKDIQKQFRPDRSPEAVKELIRRLTSSDADPDAVEEAVRQFPGIAPSGPVGGGPLFTGPAQTPPEHPLRPPTTPANPTPPPLTSDDIFGDLGQL